MDKLEKWKRCQELEESYVLEGKHLQWGSETSEQYWKDKLLLDDTDGKILEVGCGPLGLFTFKENVVGLDSIDYSENALGDQFIHGMMEDLSMFQDDYFDVVICCNSLDHCLSPETAVKEMFRVSKKIVFWSNVFNPIAIPLMMVIDATHPFHFTMVDIEKLFNLSGISSNRVTRKVSKKLINIYYPTATTILAKIKLIGSYIFGTSGLCIHIERNDS